MNIDNENRSITEDEDSSIKALIRAKREAYNKGHTDGFKEGLQKGYYQSDMRRKKEIQ